MTSPNRILPVAWLLLAWLWTASAQALEPETHFGRQTVQVLTRIEQTHYRDIDWNDRKQQIAFFQDYLDALDPSRSLFTKFDVQRLERLRKPLIRQIRQGKMELAFSIHNDYLARATERLNYQLGQLQSQPPKVLDTDSLLIRIDRSEQPYKKDTGTLHYLWEKQLANEYILIQLQQQSAIKPPPRPPMEQLIHRLQLRLKRLNQIRSEEVYALCINSLLNRYDPHTNYYSPYGREDFEIRMATQLEGIGALLTTKDEYVEVHSLTHGGPAEHDGRLKSGDRIIGVAQGRAGEMIDVVGWRIGELVRKIRGAKGTVVRLSVLSEDNSTSEIDIVRDKVSLAEQVAVAHMFEVQQDGHTWKIAIAKLPSFYEDHLAPKTTAASASRDLRKALDELITQGANGIVLDLRNNTGGSLTEANKVAGLFLDRKPIVQVQDSFGNKEVMADYKNQRAYQHPLVVLVNEHSASASEIVAAAIQDYGRGLIIGNLTHGKGSVQSVFPVGKAQVNITIAKFFRISGGSTQRRGVKPDLTMPTLLDSSKIGERNLDTALPWTSLQPMHYAPISPISIAKLNKQYQQRTATSPGFILLREQQQRLAQLRKREFLPLSISARKALALDQRTKMLEITNAYHTAIGQPTFEVFADMEQWEREEQKKPALKRRDILLREAANILVDYIRFNEQPQVLENEFVMESRLWQHSEAVAQSSAPTTTGPAHTHPIP